MSTFLIEIALGPVQGFIAAARRSRDLWAGSFLLSGCARAAGQALLDGGATLIYPVAERVLQLDDGENSNLSNVLLAQFECHDALAAGKLARRAQQCARVWLQEQADQALKDWEVNGGVKIRKDLWAPQVADALEGFAAWCVVDGDYRAAYDATKSALGARKNTRNFAPMFASGSDPGFGVPKSSLDGVRESVLPKGRKRFPARFGVSEGEQLDALGCIKRVVGKTERFTSLTRIAADGWLACLPADALAALRNAHEPLVKADLATRSLGNDGIYADFPFDAGLLYPERLEAAIQHAAACAAAGEPDDRPLLVTLRDVLKPLWKNHGQPCPYAAIVVADGDRMGRFIDKCKTRAQHSAVSRAIAAFADTVPATARLHRGHSIYNGGEDLMVLFPLAGVVDGARALAASFDTVMAEVVKDLLGASPDPDDLPTLRVGAAICHVLEPLGVIRQHGDAAEKFAKGEAGAQGQGNALGVRLHVRAGHVVPWRARFDAVDDFASLQAWVAAYRAGTLPGKLAYRIRETWTTGRENGLDEEVIALEVQRAVEHASERGGEAKIDRAVITRLNDRARRWATAADASGHAGLVDELILARWLSARSKQDLGRGDA